MIAAVAGEMVAVAMVVVVGGVVVVVMGGPVIAEGSVTVEGATENSTTCLLPLL